jgi:predicted aspartyl protease
VTFHRPASPIQRLFLVLAAAVLSWGGVAGCGPSSSARPSDRHASVAVAPGGRVEVPIRPNRAGAPLVPVRGKTSAPWEMMLDTGAPSVVVSPAVAAREGWPVRHGEMYSVDGLADAKMIRIGGTAATFRDFDAMVMSPKSLKFGEGTGDGALGLMLFHDVLLTVDFPNNRLILEPGSLPEPDGRDVLPMKLDAAGHAFVPIRVGTREVWAMIDTGFSSGLAVPTAEARQFPGASRFVIGDLVTTWHGTVRSKTARLT